MTTKRQSKPKNALLTILTIVILAAGWAYTQGYFDKYIGGGGSASKTAVSMQESEHPKKHINAAISALDGLETQDRCSHSENNYSASCKVAKYERAAQFGEAWVDVDQDGCSTREQVLQRDMDDVALKGNCYVKSGSLDDPYTGKTITDRSSVDIDHIVPLSLAWDLGANEWDQGKRVAFANDTEVNLLAVDGPANKDKSDKTLSDWEPATDYTCTYTIKYVWVLHSYGLPVTPEDRSKAEKDLNNCTTVYGEPTDAEPLSKQVQQYAAKF